MKLHFTYRAAPALLLLAFAACGGGESPPPGQTTTPSETSNQQAPIAAGSTGSTSSAGTNATKPAEPTTTKPATEGPAGAGASGSSTSTGAAGQPAVGSGDVVVAGSGGSAQAAAGSGGAPGPAVEQPPAVACDPAQKTAEAEEVALSGVSDSSGALTATKGPEMGLIEHDPGLADYTIYRPATLAEGKKYPIVVWANGGCGRDGLMFARFLHEISSYGFVIVAWGTPNGTGMGPLTTNGEPQKAALDWIVAEAERPCSKYYRKLDTSKIAAMGQSCGGLMTMGVSGDKRLSTVVIWNSGMFERDQMIYMGLHTPMAYFIGGPDDVAYAQAEDDFAAISTVPLFYGNAPVGHFATYAQPNGGEFGRVGVGWLKWQLYGDESETGGKMFVGADCELCKNSMWTVQKKMME
jgi:hypothetical protein